MRHVSRTHRVVLDWLFDRINLDPRIQIKYVDTKKPTRRHFDERLNIISDSMFSCSHLRNHKKKSNHVQEADGGKGKQGGEDERVVANSRHARHVVSMTLHQSATVPSSSSSQSLENMTAKSSKRQCLAGSTESEVIVLDAGLRLQGIPCSWSMGCCDRCVTFFDEYQIFHPRSTGKLVAQLLFQHKKTNSKCWWTVTCRLRCHKRTLFSRWIKCRSPTETRVQNTHRVALDGLFDRVNLEPKSPNQILHQKPTRRHVDRR